VSEGASVENGQLLVRLKNTTLQSKRADKKAEYRRIKQELKSLRSTEIDPELKTDVTSARRSVMQLQSRLEGKRLQLKRLRSKRSDLDERMKRVQNLYLLEAVSEQEYREVQSSYEDVDTQVKETTSTVASLESELKEAKKTVKQMNESIAYHRSRRKRNIQEKERVMKQVKEQLEWLRKGLERLKVRAPRDGVVTNIHRYKDESVARHETMLTLSSEQNQWIVAYVPVKKYSVLQHGQPVAINVLGDQKRLGGVVDLRRSPHASGTSEASDPGWKGSPSDLEYDTVPVRVNLKKSDVTLRSGTVVRVRISLNDTYFTWFS
jgi:multidrug resistance efflux pump